MKKFIPTERQRQDVRTALGKWKFQLFLNSWEIVPEYAYEDVQNRDGTIRADVSTDPDYHTATVTFYPIFFRSTEFEREQTVIHELVHCLVEPMQYQIKELLFGNLITERHRKQVMERCVTHIANAFHLMEREHSESLKPKKGRRP